MNPLARFPSKERVVRDDVLVYAEGDDIPVTDLDELERQGYDPASGEGAVAVRAPHRVERDGVLLYAEGDLIPIDVATQLDIKPNDVEKAPAKKATAKKPAKKATGG